MLDAQWAFLTHLPRFTNKCGDGRGGGGPLMWITKAECWSHKAQSQSLPKGPPAGSQSLTISTWRATRLLVSIYLSGQSGPSQGFSPTISKMGFHLGLPPSQSSPKRSLSCISKKDILGRGFAVACYMWAAWCKLLSVEMLLYFGNHGSDPQWLSIDTVALGSVQKYQT